MRKVARRVRGVLGRVRRSELVRQGVVGAYLSLPPVRRRLTRRARLAWQAQNLVFVCYGNICRSPFAEQLACAQLGPDRKIVSAGYYPEAGRRSPAQAVTAANAWNVDLRVHRSRVLDEQLLREAGAVFVFDRENYKEVIRTHPPAWRRLHLFGALAEHGPLPVPDPWGGPLEGYKACYRRIAELIGSTLEPPGHESVRIQS